MRADRASRIARAALLTVAASVGVAKADLVGRWDLNGNLNDSSGNGNNGTFAGTALPTFSNDIPAQFLTGQSVSFGGVDQRIEAPDSDSLDITGTMTVSAWVKPIGNITWDGIIAKNPSDNTTVNGHAGNYELRIENGNRRLTFLHQRGGVNDTISYQSTKSIASDLWQHIAVTAENGGQVRFYVNGVLSGAATINGTFGVPNAKPFMIGNLADLTTTPMDGLIDHVEVYNHVLSASEILTLAGGETGQPNTPYSVLSPIFARASTEFIAGADQRTAVSAVNGNGLVGKAHVNNPPSGQMWLTNGSDASPVFEIDLGGTFNVNDLRVWNYNEAANPTCCLDRGVKTADIFVAGADGVYGATPVLTGVNLNKAPGTNSDFSQVVDLGGTAARFIKLNVTSNHGDPGFTGLSEVGVTGTARPGEVPLPTAIQSVSSNIFGFNRNANFAVNGAGLGFGGSHSVGPDGNMWLNQGSFANVPAEQFDLDPFIVFDIGSVQPIDRMVFFNYNEFLAGRSDLLDRGIRTTDILIAGEDLQFETLLEGVEFEIAPGEALSNIGQVVNFGGASARYVKFDNITNFGNFENFVGISEVQFFGVVPEPSSVLLLGLGALAMSAGRRRRSLA